MSAHGDINASGSDHAASKLLRPLPPLGAKIEQANDQLSLLESKLEPASTTRSEVGSLIPREEKRDTLYEDKVMVEGLDHESENIDNQRRTKRPDGIGDRTYQHRSGTCITPIRAALKDDKTEGQATGAIGYVSVPLRHQTPRQDPVDQIDGHREEMRLSVVKADFSQGMPQSKRHQQDALADSANEPQQSPSVEESGQHPTPYKHVGPATEIDEQSAHKDPPPPSPLRVPTLPDFYPPVNFLASPFRLSTAIYPEGTHSDVLLFNNAVLLAISHHPDTTATELSTHLHGPARQWYTRMLKYGDQEVATLQDLLRTLRKEYTPSEAQIQQQITQMGLEIDIHNLGAGAGAEDLQKEVADYMDSICHLGNYAGWSMHFCLVRALVRLERRTVLRMLETELRDSDGEEGWNGLQEMEAAFETFEALEEMVREEGEGKGRGGVRRWGVLLFEHRAPSMMDRECCTRRLVGTVTEMREESRASNVFGDEDEGRVVR